MARKSSANLELVVGKWITRMKLYRIETDAQAPCAILTHTCRSEPALVSRCVDCQKVIVVTGVQQSGKAKGKAATEPRDIICPQCNSKQGQESVLFCGSCNRVVPTQEIEDRLALNGKTVKVDASILDAWRALLPAQGTMHLASIELRNTLGSYLLDEAYQLVPEKGSVLSFALWIKYLITKKAALIVHFQMQKTFKVGAVYVASVRGIPVLILHTLLGFEEIFIEPFDVPEVSDDLVDRVHELTTSLWRVPLLEAVANPQAQAFQSIFQAAESGRQFQIKMLGALPGELDALSVELSQRLTPSKPKKSKEKERAE